MKITPNTRTLEGLLQPNSDVTYNVPEYQRNYSWKEEQIETLYTDIKNEEKGYYVGNLLIYADDYENHVIDGQQRLTTLSLLLLGVYENLRKFHKELDDTDKSMEVSEQMSDIRRYLLIDRKDVRLKLLDNDKNVWKNITRILNGDKPGGWKKYTLFKRYDYIRTQLIGQIDNLEELLEFQNKLSNVVLLEIAVPDLNDSYQVFASLNSKGLPLTPLDLLKNIYLSKGGEVDKWNELKSLFEKEDEVDDTKLRQFILYNYDGLENYENAQSLTKGKIVKKYEKLFNEKKANYIENLIYRAKIFNKISNNERQYTFSLSGLSKLDATTSYPLLLNLMTKQEEYELTEEHINKIVNILIILYVRRNITLIPKASNLRHDLLTIKNYIYKNGLKADDIVMYINKEIKKIIPKDEQLASSLDNGIYDRNKKTTRFILITLEREKGNFFNKAKRDTLDEFTNEKGTLIWSIEHILPQGLNLSDYWKDVISPDDREKAMEIRDEYVHKLGNLTLTPYNSELGNKTFVEKLNFSDNKDLVGLNLGIYLNESINKKSNQWNIEDIEERNSSLVKDVIEIFNLIFINIQSFFQLFKITRPIFFHYLLKSFYNSCSIKSKCVLSRSRCSFKTPRCVYNKV
ncbi:DUF262 domain-containing HNH endonuclease family protein [Staphylococcus epidermidis]|uniref:DUF262 domain-containing protein n=1 Tax=Staphylococcus epidermidis TaxID=1282 RepID=UPI0011A3A0D6|nr:DUF262 domain-containing protein [Staphylococcus epidermidis]MCO6303201.1 DUF262 domain-containing HNH endonuclease family protein [Staphylococcus epidermidis]